MTKARTAAQKLKAKRGRPRIEGAHREPNGRISRANEPSEINVALETRARMLNISLDKARDQKAGTFLGYLALIGGNDGLSERQYQAAMNFQSLRNAYLMAIKAPNASVDAQTIGRPGDAISDEYADWCRRTKEAYGDARKAVQEAQNGTRTDNLWAALDLVVIQEQPIFNLIGATRVLCNALAKHFGN